MRTRAQDDGDKRDRTRSASPCADPAEHDDGKRGRRGQHCDYVSWGVPDRAVLRMTKADLQNALAFR